MELIVILNLSFFIRLLNTILSFVYVLLLYTRRKRLLHINNLIYYLLCILLWNASYVFLGFTTSKHIIFLYCRIIYSVVPLTALFIFYFGIEYSLQKRVSKILYLAAIIPLASVLLSITAPLQHWFISFNAFPKLIFWDRLPVVFGFWFYIHVVYSYILTLITCILLFITAKKNEVKNRPILLSLSILLFLFVIVNCLAIIFEQYHFHFELFHFMFINISYLVIFSDEDNVSLSFMKKDLIEASNFPILFFNAHDELLESNSIAKNYFFQLGMPIEKYKKISDIFCNNRLIKLGEEKIESNSKSYCCKDTENDCLFYFQCINVYNKKHKVVGKIINLYDLETLNPLISQLQKEAYQDNLCNCFNRSYLNIQKEKFLKPENFPISLFVIDIDGLKNVNDDFGHKTGDVYIQTAVEIIKKSIRINDLLFRIGGDEFLVLIPNMDIEAAKRLSEKMHEKTKECNMPYPVSFSVGISIIEDVKDDFDTHFKIADDNMYKTKLSKKE